MDLIPPGAPNAPVNQTAEKPPDSLFRHAWRRLSRSWSALTGLVLVIFLLFLAFFGPWLAPKDFREQDTRFEAQRAAPSAEAWFGKDDLGRDIFSRILYGAHLTLGVGAGTVLIGLLFGIPMGLISGYFGGRVDQLIMRFVDIMLAFPDYLLALALMAALEPNLRNAMLAIGLVFIPKFARLVRASALQEADRDYILAARSTGAGHIRIIFRHLLPNCLAPIIVISTLSLGSGILYISALSFLGLGAEPPYPEWGRMLADGKESFYFAPHIVLFPGIAIMMAVLGVNLLGDGLRDALDVRMSD